MPIEHFSISNVRCFENTHSFQTSPRINLLVGKNNSGKSTILRGLLAAQGDMDPSSMPRAGHATGSITMRFSPDKIEKLAGLHQGFSNGWEPELQVVFQRNRDDSVNYVLQSRVNGSSTGGINRIFASQPHNLFFPFLAKRKGPEFEHSINATTSRAVTGNFSNLYARVIALLNDDDLKKEFSESCEAVLQQRIGVSESRAGQVVGIRLNQTDYIPLSAMGEGVANILALLVDLWSGKKHIFLIEEPENDIHPQALKALLEIIVQKSAENQFFISTHSNIVVRHLGAVETAKIFSFQMGYKGKIPTATVVEVPPAESARQELLKELGYEPFDFGLWQGYLFLEESSAESIVNQILIPNFVPKLSGKLRTIAAGGVNDVEPRYTEFHRLFVFTHTSQIYNERTWVRVDGDEAGKKTIEELNRKFPKAKDRFSTYQADAFERYYPRQFQKEADLALNLPKQEKREAKRALCLKVLAWANAEPERAREDFSVSAKEIIDDLRQIQFELR